MDYLQETIATLSSDEVREFRLFINRQKKKKNRKDLELFHLLQEKRKFSPAELASSFYKHYNRNGYHSIRKRLYRHLTDFLLLKQKDDDASAASSAMSAISLSKFLFDRKLNVFAWIFLEKAEKIATGNELFDLLNSIYNLMIERFVQDTGAELKTIIKKRNENKKLLDEDERTIIAKAIIQNELNSLMREGKEINFDRVINRVLKECDLNDVVAIRPKLLYNIISIVRSAILAKKDYYSFEPYIIELYKEAETKFIFSKSSHYYKLSLLYMVAHVLYRNRKFDLSEKYLKKLREEMDLFEKSHFETFYPKYTLLIAVVKSYRGKNPESIQMHEEDLRQKVKFSFNDEMIIQLNLAVYYFNAEAYKKSNEIMHQFEHSDAWYEKKLGKEWVLRKNLVEMIIQCELGNEDIAMNRIRSMERHFAVFFEHPIYRRVKVFLGFVKEFINDPSGITTKEFEKKVLDSNIFLQDEQEDIRAIAFFCWLKSKMTRQPYYDVLVERVNSRVEI